MVLFFFRLFFWQNFHNGPFDPMLFYFYYFYMKAIHLQFKLAAIRRDRTQVPENISPERIIIVYRKLDMQRLLHIVERRHALYIPDIV